MKFKDISVRLVKKTYRIISNKKFINPKCDINRQSANDKIYKMLSSDAPCMISRFGTVELNCINNYICIYSKDTYLKKIKNFITDKTHTPWWNEEHFTPMHINAGIFPPSIETSIKFSERYLKDIPCIDLLGSHQYYEKFMPLANHVIKVHLETLYPFFVHNPWTNILKNKKVLIVHPFNSTIKNQYAKRELLFNNDILPEFELITLKAIQSGVTNNLNFKNWLDALKYMEDKISSINFDICLLGCGAYGMPLAAHVKRLGKKSIHIGGGLQLLFGIKGKRWDNPKYGQSYNIPGLMKIPYSSLYNEHWIKPLIEDTPRMANKVEDGCYW